MTGKWIDKITGEKIPNDSIIATLQGWINDFNDEIIDRENDLANFQCPADDCSECMYNNCAVEWINERIEDLRLSVAEMENEMDNLMEV